MPTASNLAPIVLFCYNRPWHLGQTIESLKNNTLAHLSDLIVYSDGSKSKSDEPLIKEVRRLLETTTGFKSVTIIASEQNRGLANSVIAGVTTTLSKYKKVIVLEDDLVFTTDFLSFINEALDTYENRQDIYSVTGYCPPISLPPNYKGDLFMAPRASSWGWGTWTDRWKKADWEVADFDTFKRSTSAIQAFTEGGEDLWPMLYKQQKSIIDSWAIRWTYCQFKNRAYGVYPVKSKIKNIGTDGSGTNFNYKTDYYDSEISTGKIAVDQSIMPQKDALKAFKSYYRLPFLLKIKNLIKYGV